MVDSTWTVTVNSLKKSIGDQFSTPKSGAMFVIVDVTIKNTSSTQQNVSSLISFTFKDSTGQAYTESITDFSKAPDGALTPGDILRGQLAYEVPTTQHSFTFRFASDLVSTDIATWSLSV